jgi:hypothetical protein
VTGDKPLAVVLDPSEELVPTLGRIEDWLLFADADDPSDDAIVVQGAHLAGILGSLLRHSTRTAPDFYTPDGRVQLAPLVAVPADLRVVVAAVHRAVLAAPHEQPPPGTFRTLDLLHRCGCCSRSDDGTVLAAAARSGPGTLRLDSRQYRAYQRFARLVLVDPFDRFIAMPSAPALGGCEPSPDMPNGPEVGL